jgi:DNA-binding GntR family transcriptional regulator
MRPVRPAAAVTGRAGPLYAKVTQALNQRIRDGHYALGGLLPPEMDLAEDFQVSRQTLRLAIAQLRSEGILSARRGVGTRVERLPDDQRFLYASHSFADVAQLARETRLEFHRRDEITARGKLAQSLGGGAGRRWLHLCGLCRAMAGEGIVGLKEVFIDLRYAAAVPDVREPGEAVFARLQQIFGVHVEEIRQEVRPMLLTPPEQLLLGTDSLALQVSRRYFARGAVLVMVAHTVLPADRFVYSMTFRQE